MKYMVALDFIYSDVVHVEAENEKEAIAKAMLECKEEYSEFHNVFVSEE